MTKLPTMRERATTEAELLFEHLRSVVMMSNEGREIFCSAFAARISNSPFPEWHHIATAVSKAVNTLR